MESADEQIAVREVQPIIEGMGYQLVELTLGRTKHMDSITVVIYKQEGVTLNNCVEVSRNIQPRLELLEEFENITLKVTSPGIDRVLKRQHEYKLFTGRGVKILLMQQSEWTSGIILGLSGEKLRLKTKAEVLEIDINTIKKAKLDYTEEGKVK